MDFVPNTNDSENALAYLAAAREKHNQEEIARHLHFSSRHVRRWERGELAPPVHIVAELQRLLDFGPRPPSERDFRFIDLFAGIGGIRRAFEEIGGECVFTSEWDAYARKTYAANFSTAHSLNHDITKVHEEDVPDHDVLLAGFPCQPFSIAGVSKKNALGRKHGFEDETQGTLFFDLKRIIAAKRPNAFLLENVKNLQSHDRGHTWDVIRRTLEDDLGYHIYPAVIDGAHFVPQHRERILIVGFRDPVHFDWGMLELPAKDVQRLDTVLHHPGEPVLPWDEGRYFDHARGAVHPKYTLTDKLWTYLQEYKKKHQAKGNGFGFGLVTGAHVARTLSARYYKDGSEILVDQGPGRNPRRLTPRECARLMGFPDTFRIPVSDTRAYKQFGNSVVVPVMQAVAAQMQLHICDAVQREADAPRLVA
jgi:DNA (cytosine-5)-methyltransferase 1